VAHTVSRVDQATCIGCGICEALCPFSAIQLSKVGKRKKAETITASCKGCGICAPHCPTLSISMGGFTDEAIKAQIHAFASCEREEDSRKSPSDEASG
jgi:heterodisulfide reductase subunit A